MKYWPAACGEVQDKQVVPVAHGLVESRFDRSHVGQTEGPCLLDSANLLGQRVCFCGGLSGISRSTDDRGPCRRDRNGSAGAPVLTISTVPGKNHVVLTWTTDPSHCSYEIHRNPTPYFSPGPATLWATLPADATTYTDYLAARNVEINYFYIVRAQPCAGGTADSGLMGEFDFPLWWSRAEPGRPIGFMAWISAPTLLTTKTLTGVGAKSPTKNWPINWR